VEALRAPSDEAVATADEVEELRNEIAELRQEADELRYRLKESEARLGTVEEDSDERARIIDTLLEWCQEQETVLGKHREVVAAMGAAARLVEQDAFADDLEPLPPPPSRPSAE
jgi:predicted  nucleic acid-binding Zn-ribbon protein